MMNHRGSISFFRLALSSMAIGGCNRTTYSFSFAGISTLPTFLLRGRCYKISATYLGNKTVLQKLERQHGNYLQSKRALVSMSASPKIAMVRAAHVLVSDESVADLVLQRVVDGESFADIARELSSCPSKSNGGDLGWFKEGQMVPEFEKACFSNESDTMVKVKTEFGWHVIAILQQAFSPMNMQAHELAELLDMIKADSSLSNDFQLVDVREPHELDLAKISNPEFINMPLSMFNSWGPSLLERDSNCQLDPSKETIVLCHAGIRSMQMAEFLSYKAGFKKVWNVAGGIHAYAMLDKSIGIY